MYKLVLIVVAIFCTKISVAQDSAWIKAGIPLKDGKIVYEKVDTIPGLTEKELFNSMLSVIVDSYKDYRYAVKFQDKETAKIIFEGHTKYIFKTIMGMTDDPSITFTIEFQAKENRYRLKIYNITHDDIEINGRRTSKYATPSGFIITEYKGSKKQMQWRENALLAFNNAMLSVFTFFKIKIQEKLKDKF